MEQFLAALGAGTNDLLAAFLGSACGAFLITQPTGVAIVRAIFIGTCFGTYAAPNMMNMLGKQPNNLMTFLVASVGPAVLLYGGDWVKKRVKLNFGGQNGEKRDTAN